MAILIRDMAMPKKCCECKHFNYIEEQDTGETMAAFDEKRHKYVTVPITKEVFRCALRTDGDNVITPKTWLKRRPAWCPLKEVQTDD